MLLDGIAITVLNGGLTPPTHPPSSCLLLNIILVLLLLFYTSFNWSESISAISMFFIVLETGFGQNQIPSPIMIININL